jgi:hypothetical protein
MNGFSKYATFEELTNSKGHPNLVEQNRIDAVRYQLAGKRLSKLLESIRHILGDEPLKITSGYRNIALNKAVGSIVTKSSHTRFEAADVIPSIPIKEAFTALMNAQRGGLLPDLRKCIIEKNTWLHIEVSMSVGDYKGFLTTADGINYTKVA